ncbi:alpha/beta hydrolase [Rhizobium sp. TH2]|uniref:alpha/beta hydrolase n=1 Tax=Rhizobium sp. TH2 TaxID=2775403 RepID=UPI00215862DC|nr:alpha/beta hydrolase [Rhizobium sp. TH2]
MDQNSVRRPVVDRSRLRPEIRRMLEEADRLGAKPVEEQTPVEARASSEVRLGNHWGVKDAFEAIETFTIAGEGYALPVRLYLNPESSNTILYFHGGGWVVGSLETHDGALRALALAARANILSVEYRKAPEAPFPAGLDDAERALRWLRKNGEARSLDAGRVIAAGDSAGASIASALAMRARDAGAPLFGQVLVYPATDLVNPTESRAAFALGYSLNKTTLDWFAAQYLAAGVSADHPEVSPLLATDHAGLPSTLLITADHDPLRDEGRAYAAALIKAGNQVTYEEWRGVVHGFMIMDRTTPAARQLIGVIARWCNELWSRR